jgi:hypothetical protein
MFYVTSQLGLAPGVKAGTRFKAGQVLALDPSFFSALPDGSVSYKTGLLVRVAIAPLDQTYEDSLMITHKLAEETAALVTMERAVSLGRRANLQSVVRVGDVVNPNSPLAIFENVADDADVAALLLRVGKEFDEAIAGLARNVALAKYAGRVVEVRTYYNVDPAELSPSLQAYLKRGERGASVRRKASAGASPGEFIRDGGPQRITRDKVGGEQFDGVLIVFFIQVRDVAGPGDKYVTACSALKSVTARVFEKGEEPLDEEGNQIDYIISPLSVVSRMTEDVFLNMWCNGILVKLKEKVLGILAE